ncbi:MAG: glycosyltransferase, partial [Geobacteraceae bacterium]|nr:glycosyltransferase [Geobacteraceae bacterium]
IPPVCHDTSKEGILLSDEAATGTFKNKPLSVLFVVHGFPPACVGGVEVYTRNLAIEAASRGIDVTVLYPVKSKRHLYSFFSETVDGLRLTSFHVPPGRIWTNIVSDEIDRAFGGFLRDLDFDIVHFHHIFHHLSLSMVEVAIKSDVPVAVTLHDFWFICHCAQLFVEDNMSVCSGPETSSKCADCISLAGSVPGIERADLEQVIAFRHEYARRLLAYVDLLFAPSRFVADTFDKHGFGGGRIVVAPLGIGKIAVRRSKPGRNPIFGYIGTIQPLKNVKMLLRAFSATHGEATLRIYGGGNNYWIKDLRDSITDPRITYHGSYVFEKLPEIFADIDILIVPSLIESFCLTVREALSAGIPVVAARTGGIPEIVTDGVNGFLFDPSDEGCLTRILQRFISDGDLLRKLDAKALPVMTIAGDASFLLSQYNMIMNQSKLANKGALPEFKNEMENLHRGIGLKDLSQKMEREYLIFKYGSKTRTEFKIFNRKVKSKLKYLFSYSR